MPIDRAGPGNTLFASPESAARFAEAFLAAYTEPAFGARSKSEIDLLVFSLMIDAGLVDPKAHAFETSKRLTVSTTKVKSLVQTWYLRHQPSEATLTDEVVAILLSAKFVKDSNYIVLTITNGFVRDYFYARLQKLNHTVDRSFNPDLVRLTADALAEFMAAEAKASAEAVTARLVQRGVIADTSVTGVMKEIVKKLAQKVGDEAVGELAGGIVGSFSGFVTGLFKGDPEAAAAAAEAIIA